MLSEINANVKCEAYFCVRDFSRQKDTCMLPACGLVRLSTLTALTVNADRALSQR